MSIVVPYFSVNSSLNHSCFVKLLHTKYFIQNFWIDSKTYRSTFQTFKTKKAMSQFVVFFLTHNFYKHFCLKKHELVFCLAKLWSWSQKITQIRFLIDKNDYLKISCVIISYQTFSICETWWLVNVIIRK